VAAGLTERDGACIHNTAILLSPEGEILARHRKINELAIAHYLYDRGTSIQMAHTAAGDAGLLICADNFPETVEFAHALGRMGARLLLSPCAWAVDADHDNAADPYGGLWLGSYSQITRAHRMTVVGVSNVGWITDGPWKGRKCIGNSIAMGPGAELLAMGPYGVDAEALITIEAPL